MSMQKSSKFSEAFFRKTKKMTLASFNLAHVFKGTTTVLKLGVRGVLGGCALSPEIFLSENGEFWCILGGTSALYVATAQESEAEEEGRKRALVKDDILH